MDKIVSIHSKYVNETLKLVSGRYANGRLALMLESPESGEAYCTVTVNIPEEKLTDNDCFFLKGWSENEGVPEALVAAGVITLTGRTVKTGHVTAAEGRLCPEQK